MLEDVLVPIFICVVLPVAIVWLVQRAKRHETDRKAEIMLKAIESGVPIDADMFKSKSSKPQTVKEKQLGRLTGACVTSFLGIAFIVCGLLLRDEMAGAFRFSPLPMPIVGGILIAVGLALFIVYFVGKQMLAKEMEAEEKALEEPRQ